VDHFAGVGATQIGAWLSQAMYVAFDHYWTAGINLSLDSVGDRGVTHTG
jgi:hypothetical protein